MNRYRVRQTALAAAGILLGAGLVFVLLVGFSLGWMDGLRPAPVGRRGSSVPGGGAAPAPVVTARPSRAEAAYQVRPLAGPSADPGRLAFLEQENRRLTREMQELQGRLGGVLNWILANFKGKVPLPETMMERLSVPPVSTDYTLHPEAAQFFRVTPGEEQQINDIFSYARAYLAEIEAALLTATSPRPDKVILHIPPFQEHGRMLQEDVYAALEITLGPERFDRFLRVSEVGLRSSFYQFGEASRTMVFELVYAGEREPPLLKIKDGWILQAGPGVRTVTATESTVTNLPDEYLAYRPWLTGELVGPAR